MQLQADVLETRCVRPTQLETTALGSAFLAGLAVGRWEAPSAVAEAWATERSCAAAMDTESRETLLTNWKKAVERA